MTLKIDFGKRIKELRESLFMSQETLAEKLGVHRNTLARIENGDNFVSLETLEKIRATFDVEYDELFMFNKPAKKDPHKAFMLKFKELNDADAKFFLSTINSYLQTKQMNSNNIKKGK